MTGDLQLPLRGAGLQRDKGSDRLALGIALALSFLVVAVLFAQGMTNIVAPIRAIAFAALAAVSIALVIYRPVLFPFVAYVAAVPFDNLLQTGGGTLTKFLGVASAIAILLTVIDPKRAIAPSRAILGWAAFLIWSIASMAWAADPAFGVQSLLQVIELFVLYAVVAMVRVRGSELRWMLIATLLGGVAASVYGLVMYAGGHVSATDALSQRLNLTFGTNSYINADHFSGALVFPSAIALVGFLRLKGWPRIGAAAAFVLLLAGILVSATRGSLIAVGVMTVYLAIVERRRMQLAVLGGIGLLASAAMPNIWLRFLDPEQGGFGGRTGIWAIGMDAFKHHWLVGDGTGNFRVAYTESYLRIPQVGFFMHRWAEDSHNLLVNTGVELGIVGIVLVLVAWFVQFKVVSSIPRWAPLGYARSIAEAGTLGLFVVAMAVDLMWYKYLWLAFMFGVLARNAAIAPKQSRQ